METVNSGKAYFKRLIPEIIPQRIKSYLLGSIILPLSSFI
jgi:hypothetical protein